MTKKTGAGAAEEPTGKGAPPRPPAFWDLIWPLAEGSFFDQYWNLRPLHIDRSNHGYRVGREETKKRVEVGAKMAEPLKALLSATSFELLSKSSPIMARCLFTDSPPLPKPGGPQGSPPSECDANVRPVSPAGQAVGGGGAVRQIPSPPRPALPLLSANVPGVGFLTERVERPPRPEPIWPGRPSGWSGLSYGGRRSAEWSGR